MSAHYLFRSYNNLPNYYGYQYFIPQTAAWNNYTVPFATPPGDFYQPHYYYPNNDFNQTPTVTCTRTFDNRFCPTNTVISKQTCEFPNSIKITSAQSLAQCENPTSWPAALITQYIN